MTSLSYNDFNNLKMGSKGASKYLRPEYVETINGVDRIIANLDPEKQIPTAYDQFNVMQKIMYIPKENWNFNYGVHYSTSSDNPRYDYLTRYRADNLRSAEWHYGPQIWLMNNFSITSLQDHKIYKKMKIGLAHQFFEESRHDRNFGNANRANNVEKVNAFSVNIDLENVLSQKHLTYYGAEAVYNKINSSGSSQNVNTGIKTDGPARYPDNSNWSSYAVFMTYRYIASKKVSLQAGARYNHFLLNAKFDNTFYPFPFTSSKVNQGALTGSIGLVYNPTLSWQISTNFSTGFRSPNIDDIGKVFESVPGSVVIPNPFLEPEYAYNGEFNIAKTFSDILKIDATPYYIYLDNALVRRDFTLNGLSSILYDGEISQVQAIQNSANAYIWGIHAGVEIKLAERFGLNSRFNYQVGEEELDNGTKAPLRHAAPWFGKTHLTYTKHKFKADFYAFYNGQVSFKNLAQSEIEKPYLYAVDASGNPYSPKWFTLNLKISCQLNNHLMMNAGIENITDKRYRPYSSGLVSAGRNFIVSLRASL